MQSQREEEKPGTIHSGSVEKMTPKYCTSVQVALLNNSNIVLSLSFSEPNQPSLLIERVIIDLQHADNLANVLKAAVMETQEKKAAALN